MKGKNNTMKKILLTASAFLFVFVTSCKKSDSSSTTTNSSTTYTVTFNTFGGSTVASQTVNEGAMATEPSKPTLDGYYFIGNWYGIDALTTNLPFSFSTTAIKSNLTLYAGFLSKTLTVTIDKNGGSGTIDFTNKSLPLIENLAESYYTSDDFVQKVIMALMGRSVKDGKNIQGLSDKSDAKTSADLLIAASVGPALMQNATIIINPASTSAEKLAAQTATANALKNLYTYLTLMGNVGLKANGVQPPVTLYAAYY